MLESNQVEGKVDMHLIYRGGQLFWVEEHLMSFGKLLSAAWIAAPLDGCSAPLSPSWDGSPTPTPLIFDTGIPSPCPPEMLLWRGGGKGLPS